MFKNRLEAFSDGVLAIVITIMVLELKVPHGGNFTDLIPLMPVFLSYVLSFVYIGIYWKNHHHLIHTVSKSTGGILWANLHLLFWLSMIPFVTGWMGENNFQSATVTLYGVVLLFSALAYTLLEKVIIKYEGEESLLKLALGSDWKGKASLGLYLVGIVVSLFGQLGVWIPIFVYSLVAVLWLVPDKRIETLLADE